MPKGDHLHKDGYWSGWDEYRHGTKKQVTLAPVMRKSERKQVVNDIFDLMQDWRVTPFEIEGPVRAGMRSALCLRGETWAQADADAAGLLAAAFQRIGIPRPSWEQGQPNYTTPEESCQWCGLAVPDELATGRTKSRYCSDVCAKSALSHRDFERRRSSDAAYLNAHLTIQRMKHDVKGCKHCGTMFRPLLAGGEFCSHLCSTNHAKRLVNIPCLNCGELFKPRNAARMFCSQQCFSNSRRTSTAFTCEQCGEQYFRNTTKGYSRFCSRQCNSANMRVVKYNKHCRCCGFEFETRSRKTMFCSNACSLRARRNMLPARVAPFVPAHAVTRFVVDGWFARAA